MAANPKSTEFLQKAGRDRNTDSSSSGKNKGFMRDLSDAIDWASESKNGPVRSFFHEYYHEMAAGFKSDKREDQANAQRHYVNRTGDGKMYDDKDDKVRNDKYQKDYQDRKERERKEFEKELSIKQPE